MTGKYKSLRPNNGTKAAAFAVPPKFITNVMHSLQIRDAKSDILLL